MNKKSVLILGANGFIGNALVKALCDSEKYEVFGMDLSNNKLTHSLENKNFNFVEGDVNINNEWIEYHVRKCDIVLPLVAIATPNVYVKNPLEIFQLDFESNLKVIKWVAKYGKRIIFPSTSEVYGISEDEKFNEYTTKLVLGPIHKSRWIYSASKQLLDRVIHAYAKNGDLKFNLFRPFNWIGPKLDSLEQAQLGNGRVLSIFINNILENQDICLVGGGIQKRSFTYVDDGIDALVRIIDDENDCLDGKIFNIGNPKNDITIKQLSEILVNEYQKIHPNAFTGNIIDKSEGDFYGEGYEDIPVRVPDIEEAQTHLGWNPKTGIEESVRMTLLSFLQPTQ
tara:strand:+ start:364 stop:1383 length:1020 start_codon:yes stop_codon:yes gene_type:complete